MMDPRLEKAVLDDDDRALQKLADEGLDWKADGQDALYLAMKENRHAAARFFLFDLMKPYVTNKCKRVLYSQGDYMPDGEFDHVIKDMVIAHSLSEGRAIDAALAAGNKTVERLTLAMRYGADGLFKYLCEFDRDNTLRAGPIIARFCDRHEYVRALCDMGADIGFAAGELLCSAIAHADVEAVRYMIGKGVDVNGIPGVNMQAGSMDAPLGRHALYVAAHLPPSPGRQEIIKMLLEAGADARTGKCKAIADLAAEKYDNAVTFAEHADPGTQLPLFLALEHSVSWNYLSPFIERHYPFAKKYFDENLVQPVFNSDADRDGTWLKRLFAADIDADDGFLLKAAVACKNSTAMTALMLGDFADPNTRRDLPLKLAVMLEKPELVEPLVRAGADIYAHAGAVFAEAARVRQGGVDAALKDAIRLQEAASKKAFDARYVTGVTQAALLQDAVNADHGLLLAAKAGIMRGLFDAGVLRGLQAEDFLKEGRTGATVAGVLAARGEFDLLFSPDIWAANRGDGPARVYGALCPAHREQAAQAYGELMQEGAATAARDRALRHKTRNFRL